MERPMHGGLEVLEPSRRFERQGERYLSLATNEADPEYQRLWCMLALEAVRIAANMRKPLSETDTKVS
jgi:hypothetical protein